MNAPREALRDGIAAGAWAAVLSGAPSTAEALLRGGDPLEATAAAGSILLPGETAARTPAARRRSGPSGALVRLGLRHRARRSSRSRGSLRRRRRSRDRRARPRRDRPQIPPHPQPAPPASGGRPFGVRSRRGVGAGAAARLGGSPYDRRVPFARTDPIRRELTAALPERPFTVEFWDGSRLRCDRRRRRRPSGCARPRAVAHALRAPGQLGVGRAYVVRRPRGRRHRQGDRSARELEAAAARASARRLRLVRRRAARPAG